MTKLLVVNGPNLNLLGRREPEHYGRASLDSINQTLTRRAHADGHELECFQSNAEHEIIERIHQALADQVDVIIINPAALTHTSVAVRDALLATDIPFIEVHLSNVYRRESFRHRSYFSDVAVGTIAGFGPTGYELAYQAALAHLPSEAS